MQHIARGWAARGWAKISTISAGIRWIWPSYTYPDESSRVILYWLESHNMLGCCMDIEWWKYIWLYDNNVVGFSLPCCCIVVLYVALLSCDDHQFDWWEQMGEVLVVSKEMAIPLLSHLHGSLGLWPMYCFMLYYSILIC